MVHRSHGMQNGRDHEEREQKFATRLQQQERRDEDPEDVAEGLDAQGVRELDRRALPEGPPPTDKDG